MDSWWARLSNLVSLYLVVLSIFSVYNYITGYWFFGPRDLVPLKNAIQNVEVLQIGQHRRLKTDAFEAQITASHDFAGAFNWNTHQAFGWIEADYSVEGRSKNQIVGWDHIITDPRQTNFTMRKENSKYLINDQNQGELPGAEITYRWRYQYMPKVGIFHSHDIATLNGGRLPVFEDKESIPMIKPKRPRVSREKDFQPAIGQHRQRRARTGDTIPTVDPTARLEFFDEEL